jgi:hypothetical protein
VPDATTIQDSVPDVSPEEVPQEAPVRKKILGRRHVPSSGKTNEETEDD